jgi:hypothetical protein
MQTEIAKLSIIPSFVEVDIGENFNVTVYVSNVSDLFAWQVTIWYLHSILGNASRASCPPGHVFEGKNFMEVNASIGYIYHKDLRSFVNLTDPLNSNWTLQPRQSEYRLVGWVDRDINGEFSARDIAEFLIENKFKRFYEVLVIEDRGGGEYRIEVESAYIMFGASLLTMDTFTGSGTLCQIEFDGAIRAGQSPLNFTKAETYLLNSTLGEIPYEVGNTATTMVIPEFSSSLIMPLIMTMTILIMMVYKRGHSASKSYFKPESQENQEV